MIAVLRLMPPVAIIPLLLGCSSSETRPGEEWDVDSSSDTGTSPYLELCEEEDFEVLPSPVSVMFLQDISGSMTSGGSNKWIASKNALKTIFEKWDGPDFRVGYDLFPSKDENTCDTRPEIFEEGDSDYQPVLIDCEQFNQQSILDLNNTITPRGHTPLWCAISNFRDPNYAPGLFETDIPGYLVVVSDGEDTCGFKCEGEATPDDTDRERVTPDDFTALVDGLLTEQQIKTFVIGFGLDVEPAELNAIAAAGGTDYTTYVVASNESSLTEAFDKILASVRSCNLEVPQEFLDIDYLLVNVYFNEEKLPYDNGCAHNKGWMWTDDSHKEIMLCEKTCAHLRENPAISAQATYGCGVLTVD